ncbi:MAG: hypothetical protein IPL59_08415 [Candidatus Competibacteraceae bacterium]|nr:hypothetical protein [Candidatus Competibacteraceae bacterium]
MYTTLNAGNALFKEFTALMMRFCQGIANSQRVPNSFRNSIFIQWRRSRTFHRTQSSAGTVRTMPDPLLSSDLNHSAAVAL